MGSLVEGKGYDVLVAALVGLRQLPWELTVAGDAGRDPRYASMICAEIASQGLLDRIAILGAVNRPPLISDQNVTPDPV